jgi:hypothetical protein
MAPASMDQTTGLITSILLLQEDVTLHLDLIMVDLHHYNGGSQSHLGLHQITE